MLNNNLINTRNSIFDLLRIILTILVLNVHIRIITGVRSNFLEPFTWYTVPLFIIISFFFFSRKSLIKRIKRLFIPLIFWSIIGFIIHPNLLSLKNILLQVIAGDIVNTPLYYLVLLIWFSIINWLIHYLPTRLKIAVYTVIVVAALYLEYSSINYNFFTPMITVIEKSYGRFIELIKYVPIGLAFGFLRNKINKKVIFLILFLVFFMLSSAVSYIPVPSGFHFSGLKILTGSIAIFFLTLGFARFQFDDKVKVFISTLGKYSFGVYLSHYLLLEALLKIFPVIKSLIIFNQFLFLFCFVIFCYLFCFLFDFITQKKFYFLIK